MSKGSLLTNSIVALLKPIIRFGLRRGFAFQELSECLKHALVAVAKEELTKKQSSENVSRLSVITGLQRKDIKRLLNSENVDHSTTNLLTKVIGQWQSHPDYSLKGKAKVLNTSGNESEFASLVRTISLDVSPYTVLFALEQAGVIKRDRQSVKLFKTAFKITSNVTDSLEILSSDVNDLIKAVEENVFLEPKVPNLHITTVYDNICVEKLTEIRDWLLDKGTEFHENARQYLSKFDKDANPRLYNMKGGAKVSLSAFSLIDSDEDISNA